jgi:hypothetical protein
MLALYPNNIIIGNIAGSGRKLFGEYCGLAQQYLFYYARENYNILLEVANE